MATYTVSYRGKNGERIEEQFEAPDRNSLFKILADRKISAISVKDGAAPKRKKSSAPSKPLPPPVLRGAVAGIAVVALAAVFYLVLGNRDEKPQENKSEKTKLIREVTPSVKSPVETVQDVGGGNVEPAKVLTEDERLLQGKDTNEWIVVTDPNTGKKWVSKLMHPGLKNLPPPLFQHSSLNELDAIINDDMSDPLPGIVIDDRFVKDFQEGMFEKIEVTDEDDEERAERKTQMTETIKFLQEQIKGGADLIDLVNDALKERRRVAAFKDVMKEERARMRSDGEDESVIADYERVCNEKLKELGAKPMITKELIRQKGLERRAREAVNQ